jgi:hypothetical protein
MNNNLPYEEKIKEQLADIPLPDEDKAWEDMRQRLEDDDDDRVVPFWLRGCGLWSLMGILLLALSWWIIRPEKWWINKDQTKNVIVEQKEKSNNPDDEPNKKNTTTTTGKDYEFNNDDINDRDKKDSSAILTEIPVIGEQDSQKVKTKTSLKIGGADTKKKSPTPVTGNRQTPKNAVSNNIPGDKQKQLTETGKPVIPSQQEENDDSLKDNPAGTAKSSMDVTTDSVPVQNDSTIHADSIKAFLSDSLVTEDTVQSSEIKKDSAKSNKIFFSAGLGLQQQIPTGGQKLSPYSSLGRKNLLTDYLPSVYFQANKPDKWFANIGFRYGAPQYNKEFTYNQHIVLDSGQNVSTTTTSLTLKKSFYHQLPVTFNYYIRPGWSAGAGIVWNKFYGAVADREVIKQDAQQIDTLSKGIISFQSDTTSSFKKSYFQALIETEYNWKRFYFGIRYSFGLQPYIKFNLPGGTQQKEKNSSLQLYIRYDLWRSKKK